MAENIAFIESGWAIIKFKQRKKQDGCYIRYQYSWNGCCTVFLSIGVITNSLRVGVSFR